MFTGLDSEIINVQHNGIILLEALYIEIIINLPLYYATFSTCIAGTLTNSTINIYIEVPEWLSGCANAINSPEFLIIIQMMIYGCSFFTRRRLL